MTRSENCPLCPVVKDALTCGNASITPVQFTVMSAVELVAELVSGYIVKARAVAEALQVQPRMGVQSKALAGEGARNAKGAKAAMRRMRQKMRFIALRPCR